MIRQSIFPTFCGCYPDNTRGERARGDRRPSVRSSPVVETVHVSAAAGLPLGNTSIDESVMEQLIAKLNSSPREEDTELYLYGLLKQCVVAGGTNMRENIALYFVGKRLMELGVDRVTVDARAEEFLGSAQRGSMEKEKERRRSLSSSPSKQRQEVAPWRGGLLPGQHDEAEAIRLLVSDRRPLSLSRTR
jgi:hypothetical protein